MAEKIPIPTQPDVELRQNRDARRMARHIGDREFKRDWNSDREEQYLSQPHQKSEQRRNRNQGRATAWRKQQQNRTAPPKQPTSTPDLSQYMSTSSTALRDDPMYNFTQGSRQVFKRKCQNIEHSSFPQLCDATYRQLREFAPRLQREMPYLVFLHAMNTTLQAWLLDTARNLNQEIRWQDEEQPLSAIPREMIIPAPIAEYLSLINKNIIPNGDNVRVNIPDATVPQDNANGNIAGTFGVADANSHNAYETNISPYVTMRNVQSCARNEQLPPLPPELHPANTTPTLNLLGYVPRSNFSPDAKSLMESYRFEDGPGLSGRLRLCPALMADVSASLYRLESKFRRFFNHLR
ncbi:hypothetical protein WH47_10306 [Habropoda laboriosa]|uniref:Uncharacterized protein n=1 Tax=Habropoda laboriosa TaxID=597456 RepID=A0A0L7R4V5_9HYME|nr:hypothetical protein WH47_10306 [Habropoda laboriosa]